MKILKKIRALLFGSRTIAVGHATAADGAAVIMFVGRKFVAMSPKGARLLADQLRSWADHAETFGTTITTMKWIIKMTTKDEVEQEALKWSATGIEKAAEKLAAQASSTDA